VLSGRSLTILDQPAALDTGAPPPASSAVIAEQAKTLAEAKLEAELRKLGVPPEQYAKLDPEAKRVLYRQAYEESIRTRATAALSGCATLAVCEGTWEGNPTIAVAVVWSQNLARLAAIANRVGGQLPPKGPAAGKRLIEQIPSDPRRLVRLFGVQRCVDESGEVALVAYGQAALGRVAPEMRAAALAAAFDKAELEATAALKDFVFIETDREAQRAFSQIAQATAGEKSGALASSTQQQESFSLSVRQRSGELTLSGAGELRRWTARIDGVDVAGVVVGWSPRRQVLAGTAGATQPGGTDVQAAPGGKPPSSDPNAPGTTTFDPTW
jgi:hypothetical protein